jgi:hypothetical protein
MELYILQQAEKYILARMQAFVAVYLNFSVLWNVTQHMLKTDVSGLPIGPISKGQVSKTIKCPKFVSFMWVTLYNMVDGTCNVKITRRLF